MPLASPLAFAAMGATFGLLADRLAARWPRHDDGRVRAVDWRTLLLVMTGTVAFGLLGFRYADARDLTILTLYFAALLVLMATDLDQRLLPDLITLPMIPAALAVLLLGWNPVLEHKGLAVPSALVAGVLAPLFLLATDLLLRGGLGIGDVKLAVSLGLMSGVTLLVSGFFVASVISSLVLIALLIARRIERRSVIPFGPILITSGFVAALAA